MGLLSWLMGHSEKALKSVGDAWQVSKPNNLQKTLKAFVSLLPKESTLYVEGTFYEDIREFLEQHKADDPELVNRDTLWPVPDTHHIPLTDPVMDAFASVIARYPDDKVCSHFKVYRQKQMLLEWNDADCDCPIFITRTIDEGRIKKFCEDAGAQYVAV